MLREDDKLLKRLELYFDDRQADLALFSATLNVTIMRCEGILAELEATLLMAQALARRDRPPELPVAQDAAEVSISPANTPAQPPHQHDALDEARQELLGR
jgi:hypothetical protein